MLVKVKTVFRCDASHKIGYGHIYRCLAIAQALIENIKNVEIDFVMREDLKAEKIIKNKLSFINIKKITFKEENSWMVDWQNTNEADFTIIFFDARRKEITKETLSESSKIFDKVIILDDCDERRLGADWAFYPPVLQVETLTWKKGECRVFKGWEWVILQQEFAVLRSKLKEKKYQNQLNDVSILLTMGASDPANFTKEALEVLLKVLKSEKNKELRWKIKVVLGVGYQKKEEIKKIKEETKDKDIIINIYENVLNMPELMQNADLAIASFGGTAWELTCMKVPAILYCLTEDHALSATSLVYQGVALSLGFIESKEKRQLCLEEILQMALFTKGMLEVMHKKTEGLLDGLGAKRIAQMCEVEILNAR